MRAERLPPARMSIVCHGKADRGANSPDMIARKMRDLPWRPIDGPTERVPNLRRLVSSGAGS